MATEKVTRRALDGADQKRLVAGGAERARLLGALRGRSAELHGGARPRIRPLAVRGRRASMASSKSCASSSVSSPTRSPSNRELPVFFFSPYFSTIEKQEALRAC